MTLKTELHPRNRHRGPYPFRQLADACPDLAPFVKRNNYGNESIDFANPIAVKNLNRAILKFFYNISWDIPEPFLCPPIPSRADYIHNVADLLSDEGMLLPGKKISVLDIGTGANCIYPLIGQREYGWHFVATDIDPSALSIAKKIIAENKLWDAIEIRLQKSPSHIFTGILEENHFDLSICNPPFHASEREAKAATHRKWKNLEVNTFVLNFGGKKNELCYPGGEVAFIKRMIEESVHASCKWFTTLVSKSTSLPHLYRALEKTNALKVKTIEMGQGQKKSRILAWTHKNLARKQVF
jgi:23S rRNA (adenine1618-N6)-methyltransferase